jgi:signal peptidase I
LKKAIRYIFNRIRTPGKGYKLWYSFKLLLLITAVVTTIKVYAFDLYFVSSASMEKTFLPGDIILVNKFKYNRFGFLSSGETHRGEIVLFKFPGQSTLYVKRCIGLPGDTLHIRESEVLINRKPIKESTLIKHNYTVKTTAGTLVEIAGLLDSLSLTGYIYASHADRIKISLTYREAEFLRSDKRVQSLTIVDVTRSGKSTFPRRSAYRWTLDNFGPLIIPRNAQTISLDTLSLPLYFDIIKNVEGNTVSLEEGYIYINGKEAKTYTFTQDYYFMIGDNRHNSKDSRRWGFVPGAALKSSQISIFFSVSDDNKIRWERIFGFNI